jgi:hypothetical protein
MVDYIRQVKNNLMLLVAVEFDFVLSILYSFIHSFACLLNFLMDAIYTADLLVKDQDNYSHFIR